MDGLALVDGPQGEGAHDLVGRRRRRKDFRTDSVLDGKEGASDFGGEAARAPEGPRLRPVARLGAETGCFEPGTEDAGAHLFGKTRKKRGPAPARERMDGIRPKADFAAHVRFRQFLTRKGSQAIPAAAGLENEEPSARLDGGAQAHPILAHAFREGRIEARDLGRPVASIVESLEKHSQVARSDSEARRTSLDGLGAGRGGPVARVRPGGQTPVARLPSSRSEHGPVPSFELHSSEHGRSSGVGFVLGSQGIPVGQRVGDSALVVDPVPAEIQPSPGKAPATPSPPSAHRPDPAPAPDRAAPGACLEVHTCR